MKNGGRRPGAGRPKGARTQKTRKEGVAIAKSERTPLSVMRLVADMHLEAAEAHRLAGRQADSMREYDAAAAIHKDMAPYCHARLTSSKVEASVHNESTSVVEFIVTSREQAEQAIAALVESSGVSRQ